jgi:pimeloyl-ACP methyl ester carboxylesterase
MTRGEAHAMPLAVAEGPCWNASGRTAQGLRNRHGPAQSSSALGAPRDANALRILQIANPVPPFTMAEASFEAPLVGFCSLPTMAVVKIGPDLPARGHLVCTLSHRRFLPRRGVGDEKQAQPRGIERSQGPGAGPGPSYALPLFMGMSGWSRRSSRALPLVGGPGPPSTTPPWHHRFARVEGVRLHWAELGESTGKPPLVLLHGLKDCYRTWRQVAPGLARDRRVLMPDLPGHGLSGCPDASYELSWYAHVMERWLETAGVDRADVVGHSFGGGVAQMMLLNCPQHIRRLVLVSSGGLGREIAVSLRLASIPLVVEQLGQRFMGPCTGLALKATGAMLSSEDVARLSAMNAQSGSARAFARTVRDIIDWRGQRNTFFQHAKELSTLPPIAVFWGDGDIVIPFSHAETLAKAVDGIRVTRFLGCGHYPHHQQPDTFVDRLRDFLDAANVPAARLRCVAGRAEHAPMWPIGVASSTQPKCAV